MKEKSKAISLHKMVGKVTKVEYALKGCHENTTAVLQIYHRKVHIGLFLRKFAKIKFFIDFKTLLVLKNGSFGHLCQNGPYFDLKSSKFIVLMNISVLDNENITSEE